MAVRHRHGLRLRCGDGQVLHLRIGAASWAKGVNAAGYVVGGTNGDGFVWTRSNQSYSQIAGLASANGISNNSQLVAGVTQGGQAAV